MTAPSPAGPVPEVLVMAGGRGRRLGALTSRTPKPMLPVGGRPLLQCTLEHLRDQGVGHAYLAVCHLNQVICDYFGDGAWLGMDLEYVVEEVPLGTAGAIGRLPALTKTLLVLNGDVVTPLPVEAFVEHHRTHRAAMTLGYVEHEVPVDYGLIEGGRPYVSAVREKPDVTLTVVAGVYALSPDVVATVDGVEPLDMPSLIETVLATRQVVGFPLPGPWLDIGSPDAYARAERFAASLADCWPSLAAASAADTSGRTL